MALSGDFTLAGGVVASDLYAQVRPVLIDKQGGTWKMVYEVRVWKDQATSAAPGGTPVPCPGVGKYKCVYNPETDGDPVAFAYAHLKAQNVITNVEDV